MVGELAMSNRTTNLWSVSKGLARQILWTRRERRRLMSQMLLLALGMMAAGLWLLDHWLAANLWRFFLWWAGCAGICSLTMLFALYDFAAVILEERAPRQSDPDPRRN